MQLSLGAENNGECYYIYIVIAINSRKYRDTVLSRYRPALIPCIVFLTVLAHTSILNNINDDTKLNYRPYSSQKEPGGILPVPLTF